MQMIPVEFELLELTFEMCRVHAQVNQRAEEHVAGNAAEQIEIESLHFNSTL
jgi:hypothetical protein